MQMEMNERLLLLMRPSTSRVPKLSIHAREEVAEGCDRKQAKRRSRLSRCVARVSLGNAEEGAGDEMEGRPVEDDVAPNAIPDLYEVRREMSKRPPGMDGPSCSENAAYKGLDRSMPFLNSVETYCRRCCAREVGRIQTSTDSSDLASMVVDTIIRRHASASE